MRVQKLFPALRTGGGQFFRRGKLDHKIPAKGLVPILKGFQRRRIILAQGLLELVDQGRALLNEADFVTAQQLQLLGQRIQWLKAFPVLAIHPQSLGQRPRIQTVGLVSAGDLPLPITLGAVRIDRIDRAIHLQELINGRSLAGFNGHGHRRILLKPLAKLFPTLQGVLDAKLGDDLALAIHQHHIVAVGAQSKPA